MAGIDEAPTETRETLRIPGLTALFAHAQ